MNRRILGWVAACAAAVYAFAYADLVLRARAAYLEGEKYMAWSARPELKETALRAESAREKERLRGEREAGRLSEEEYRAKLELEDFRLGEESAESSLKHAYHWFKTASDLFSPPESRWVRLSRRRMAEAKELWKKELDAKNVPYEDYMFE